MIKLFFKLKIDDMLDIRLLRENPQKIKDGLQRRGEDPDVVDKLIVLDIEIRKIKKELDELRKERNEISREIGRLKREGKNVEEVLKKVGNLGDKIKAKETQLQNFQREFDSIWYYLPNLPHDSVPVGQTPEDNVVIEEWHPVRKLDFEPLPHWDIGERLGILEFKKASEISGSRFAIYKGAGATLERALINFFLDYNREKGYVEIFPPYLVKEYAMISSGHLPKFKVEMYHTEDDDLYLIPTAETVLANLHRNEILEEKELPKYYMAYTACFRREAGSYGKDVRGIIRVHQFNKVELFKYTKPEDSYEELEKMLQDAVELVKLLELPYRVVLLCTGDMGFAASKTYDIEVWAPGVKRWLEVSSVSNTEDFQTRRAKTRMRRKDGKTEFPHTLNGSGLATPRVFVAILENYQNKDGSITIPEVLRKYMGGVDVILPGV